MEKIYNFIEFPRIKRYNANVENTVEKIRRETMKEKITSLRETASQEIKNCKTRKRLK